MTEVLIAGCWNNRNGPEEQFLRVTFDNDGIGISHPARVRPNQLEIHDKALTFVGEFPAWLALCPLLAATAAGTDGDHGSGNESNHMSGWSNFLVADEDEGDEYKDVSIPTSYSKQQRPSAAFAWHGLVYHDNTGGIDGCTPRGSFSFRVLPLTSISLCLKYFAFVGPVATATEFGGNMSTLLVAFDAGTMQPVSHQGSFAPETNDFEIVEQVVSAAKRHHPSSGNNHHGSPSSSNAATGSKPIVQLRRYKGQWAKTTESHKFCGVLSTSDGTQGSFFFTAQELFPE